MSNRYTAICNYSKKCKTENPYSYKTCTHKALHTVSAPMSCVTISCGNVSTSLKAHCIKVIRDWDE